MSTSTMQSGVVQHTLLKLIVWIALEAIQLENKQLKATPCLCGRVPLKQVDTQVVCSGRISHTPVNNAAILGMIKGKKE